MDNNNNLKWDPVIFNDEWKKAGRIYYDNGNNYKKAKITEKCGNSQLLFN